MDYIVIVEDLKAIAYIEELRGSFKEPYDTMEV